MAPIYHIALYTFHAHLTPSEVTTATASMLTLKDRCINLETGKPYILDMVAGPNMHPELGFADGYTHALVMVFANEEDWRYYLMKDPVHTAFLESNKDWVRSCVTDIRG
ncbi:hypothetical protein N431DRAFT_430641 [Stipitochalara longipes BDJ]|nr:hypothetical protein N431DRAFT_430641 [Stipitochalara longipes BDJ]